MDSRSRSKRRLWQLSLFVCTAGAIPLAGCGGSAAPAQPLIHPTPTPIATATATPTPAPTAAAQHFYVGDDGSGGIAQYTLPLHASQAPVLTFAASNLTGLALDPSGNLAAGDNAGNLTYYTAPLSGSSVPAASFKNGTATDDGQLAFLSGKLYAAGVAASVNSFTPPFSNASVPSSSITSASLTSAIGVVFDSSANLYVSNSAATSNIFVFTPPYAAATVVTPGVTNGGYRKLAIIGNQLFACLVNPGVGQVDVYNLPLTSSSAPAFSLTNGISSPEGVATDSAGNLYVGNLGTSSITVYAPPFSATSAPTVTLSVGGGSWAVFGIAVGP